MYVFMVLVILKPNRRWTPDCNNYFVTKCQIIYIMEVIHHWNPWDVVY